MHRNASVPNSQEQAAYDRAIAALAEDHFRRMNYRSGCGSDEPAGLDLVCAIFRMPIHVVRNDYLQAVDAGKRDEACGMGLPWQHP